MANRSTPRPAQPRQRKADEQPPAGPQPGEICRHDWFVFSTCLSTVELMLECRECGELGTVAAPTKEEWSQAFQAPSHPYRWAEDARVIRRGPIHEYNVRRSPLPADEH
jgi:hypothetical protein